ncbi:hypothetical protein BLS_009949 [Venturia inaequalis]|uniref:Prolyl 4-hydroxylase alpha subunit Fe(2+) 2OG dioxygenase domain-containing protein n=1 Tax=Venturia inaequalis TaxID=5025 RepID=A0A8H3U449_VENIN|nr:hypothetical protein BLS_009949 [Venturia inaequalis]
MSTQTLPEKVDNAIEEKHTDHSSGEVLDISEGQVHELDEAEVFLRENKFTHGYLQEVLHDEAANKKILRRVDLILLPLLCGTYLLQYIDKQALSYSAVFDLFASTGTTSNEYSWLASIFYFGYLVAEWPASYAAQHWPTGTVVSCFVIAWGSLLMLTSASHNFTGLAVCRFVLGCFEALITPCFMMIVGMWYTRKEQPSRAGMFYCFNGVGSMVGGILFYGVGQNKSDFAVWRIIFLLCGGVTVIWGIVLLFFLPNNIMTAKRFTKEDKALLIARSQTNGTGVYNKTIKFAQVKEAFCDAQIWILFFFVLLNEVFNGGFANFGKLIVKGIAGGDALRTTAYGIPSGAFQMGSFVASLVLALQLPASNVGGYTKRVTATALVFLAYCVGNIIGPHAFLDSEAPVYQTGCQSLVDSELNAVGRPTGDEAVDSDQQDDSEEEDDEDEDEDEEPVDDSVFRSSLRECLGKVTSAGSFSTYHHSPSFPNPGLYIKGFGLVALPLREDDAKAIANLSTLAPFGMKEKTIVDTTVRNTWELNASEFGFQNPAWNPFFTDLVRQAMVGLGVESAVRPESYKLLLYEEGAFFKAHKDSEKVPGMFGTLVICLPSKHVGGEVHLSHAGQKKALDTATTSTFDLTALSWYSDVKHEIRPITSGYRLVLTYNLVDASRSAVKQSAAQVHHKRQELDGLFQLWKRYLSHQEKLVYILDHQYTKPSLRLQNLKGQDRALGQHLNTICSQNGFQLMFAQMTKNESDEDYGGENDLLLEHLVLPDGLLLVDSCDIEEEDILQENPFDRDADSEDEAEWTGNAETPGCLRYHDTVAVIVLSESLPHMFASSSSYHSVAGCNRIEYFCKKSQENPEDTALRANALAIIGVIAIGIKPVEALRTALTKYRDKIANRVHRASFETWMTNMLQKGEELTLLSQTHFEPKRDLPRVLDMIGNRPAEWTKTKLLPQLSNAASNDFVTALLHSLFEQRTLTPYLAVVHDAFRYFMRRKSSPFSLNITVSDNPYHRQYTAHAYGSSMMSCKIKKFFECIEECIILGLTTEAGKVLKENVEKLHVPSQPKMELTNVLELLEKFMTFSQKHKDVFLLPMTTVKNILAESTETFNAGTHKKLDLNHGLEVLEKLMRFSQKQGDNSILPTATIRKILAERIEDFNHKVDLTRALEVLEKLMNFSKNYGELISLPAATMKALFDRVLQSPIKDLIKRTPKEPLDWKRGAMPCYQPTRNGYNTYPRVPTACADCAELNRFLVNPTQQVAKFAWVGPRRNHISKDLNPRHYDLYTDKGRTPYTLVITKTKRQYEDQLSTWKRDLSKLFKQLEPFRNDWGIKVLDEKYRELILIGDILLPGASTSSATAGAVPAPRPAAVSTSNPRVPSAVTTPVQAPRPAAVSTTSSRVSSAGTTALHARTSQSLKRKIMTEILGPVEVKKRAVVIELSDED